MLTFVAMMCVVTVTGTGAGKLSQPELDSNLWQEVADDHGMMYIVLCTLPSETVFEPLFTWVISGMTHGTHMTSQAHTLFVGGHSRGGIVHKL